MCGDSPPKIPLSSYILHRPECGWFKNLSGWEQKLKEKQLHSANKHISLDLEVIGRSVFIIHVHTFGLLFHIENNKRTTRVSAFRQAYRLTYTTQSYPCVYLCHVEAIIHKIKLHIEYS